MQKICLSRPDADTLNQVIEEPRAFFFSASNGSATVFFRVFFGSCVCCGYEFAGYRWCYPRSLLFEFLPRFLVDLALPFALAFATCSFRLG